MDNSEANQQMLSNPATTASQKLTIAGAVITGSHIVYTSGKHGDAYVNKDAIYVHTGITSELCQIMASEYQPDQVDVVAGPTIGGVVLSQWVAHHLNLRRQTGETYSVYAEEEEDSTGKIRVFKRGYDKLLQGKNVVVVEDILNTGGSARKVIDAVRKCGGNVVGLSVLCNRGGVGPQDVGGVPVRALMDVSLQAWDEDECPLCKNNEPINTQVGKGKAFLDKKK